jgi:hypothetical protein
MQILEESPSVKKGLGMLLLVAGIALAAFMLFALGKDLSLWLFGQPTMAQLVDCWAEATNAGEQEELTFRYYVRYRFITPGGKTIVSTKTVSAQEWVGVGHGARGQGGVDFYSGEAEGAAAPVYQEQEHLSEFTAGGVADASQVAVVYFPPYPAHNRLEESRFVPLLACTYVPFLALAGMALLAARHLLRPDMVGQDRWHSIQGTALRAEN